MRIFLCVAFLLAAATATGAVPAPALHATRTTGGIQTQCFSHGQSVSKISVKSRMQQLFQDQFAGFVAAPHTTYAPLGGDITDGLRDPINNLPTDKIVLSVRVSNEGNQPWTVDIDSCNDAIRLLVEACPVTGSATEADSPGWLEPNATVGGWVEVDKDHWIKVDPNAR